MQENFGLIFLALQKNAPKSTPRNALKNGMCFSTEFQKRAGDPRPPHTRQKYEQKSGQNMTHNASKQGKLDSFGAIFLFIFLPCMWGWGCQMIPQNFPRIFGVCVCVCVFFFSAVRTANATERQPPKKFSQKIHHGTEQNPECRCGRAGNLSNMPIRETKIIHKNRTFLQLAVLHLSAYLRVVVGAGRLVNIPFLQFCRRFKGQQSLT